MRVVVNDGGRSAAGFEGRTGDGVTRSIAIVTGLPYREVYEALSAGCHKQRVTKRTGRCGSARNGVNTHREWFLEYMSSLGFRWVPTMRIGSGCQVHLAEGELPSGRLIVAVSKHYTAVLDGVIHDTHDPQREERWIMPYRGQALKPGEWVNVNGICSIRRRCVYGYWVLEGVHRSPHSERSGDVTALE